jgi:O-antigen/teichoic acid export membrane protein
MKMIRRIGWGISDQAFSSLTNFALGALVARAVAPAQFGAFTLAFATYTLCLSLSRSITSEPLVIRKSAVDLADWKAGTASASGVSLVLGLVGGAGCIVAGNIVGGTLGDALIPLGIMLPGLLVQDLFRNAFFARRKGAWAFANDFVWALAMFSAIGLVLARGDGSVSSFVLIWGGSAAVAALFGMLQARVLPRPQRALLWWREQKDLIPSLLGEIGALTGSRQLALYGIGAVVGLAGVGGMRGALLLLGPLNIIFMGTRIMAVPEAVRLLNRSVDRFRTAIRVLFLGLAGTTFLWMVVLLFLPHDIGVSILGRTWEPARHLLIPLAIADAAHGGQFAGVIGLRALAAAKRSFKAKLAVSVLLVVGGISGAFLGGIEGAAWGKAIAQTIGVWLFFRQLEIAIGERVSGKEGSSGNVRKPSLVPALGSRAD